MKTQRWEGGHGKDRLTWSVKGRPEDQGDYVPPSLLDQYPEAEAQMKESKVAKMSFEEFQKLDPKGFTFVRVIPPTQQDIIRAKAEAAEKMAAIEADPGVEG